MNFRVRLTRGAQADVERLYDHVLQRELERPGGDLALAEQALTAIQAGIATMGVGRDIVGPMIRIRGCCLPPRPRSP